VRMSQYIDAPVLYVRRQKLDLKKGEDCFCRRIEISMYNLHINA
jgi:hypothetical protein